MSVFTVIQLYNILFRSSNLSVLSLFNHIKYFLCLHSIGLSSFSLFCSDGYPLNWFLDPSHSICSNISAILEYMKQPEAFEKLKAHRHITAEIFEPVFIIGSFPSLLLSILTRLVVVVTWHNHFMSAYVINMAVMPLQLVTGALSIHSASFHLGDFGFECWSCAANSHCKGADFASWMSESVNVCLLVALAAKILDGGAGGCVLFVVFVRRLWGNHGHVAIWWYLLRLGLSILSFIFCVTVSALLVITPAVAVFRLDLVGKMTESQGRKEAVFASTVLLIVGLITWSASLLTIFIYLTYRTCIYCRMKEHAAEYGNSHC